MAFPALPGRDDGLGLGGIPADDRVLGHPLFDGADAGAIASLLGGVRPHRIRRGTLLSTPGMSPGLLHLVLEGRLRAYQLTPEGRELLLELIEAGGFDGVLSMAGHRGHFSEADADSLVASMALPVLERLIAAAPAVGVNLLHLTITRLDQREEHLESLVLRDPSQRLARQLLALAATVGEPDGRWVVLTPPLTHQRLADMLGVRRETITLHVNHLEELGLVERVGHHHYRVDPARLEELVEDREAVEHSFLRHRS